jgi:NADH-quinone oxidoreductase subunit C
VNGERAKGLTNKVKDICKNIAWANDNRIILEVDKGKIIDLSNRLKNLGFCHVKGVTGIDYPSKDMINITYYIGSYSRRNYAKLIVELKINLPRENPKTPSLIEIWQSCEYPERETYEMFGVIFQGHPNLERLLLPDDFEGKYPLRKGFKIPEEGIYA